MFSLIYTWRNGWANNRRAGYLIRPWTHYDATVMNLLGKSLFLHHYGDVIMGVIASQITSLAIVYSVVYSDADQWKHQSSASLAFVRRIHRGPVNFPHERSVTRKLFPFDDVIMMYLLLPEIDSTEHYILHSDLPCQGFHDLINLGRVAKYTVVIDCRHHNMTKVMFLCIVPHIANGTADYTGILIAENVFQL